MSTDLNMEYQEVKFGEIAKHISKRVEPSETTLKIYVGLEHLDPDSLKITRHGVPSDVAGQKLLVKKGQIIFGKRRAYQRKVAVADWDCICSAHAMVLEAIPGKILPEFLPFFMQSNQFMDRAVEISEGSLSPTIKWKILAEQKFSIPTISSQKKCVLILEKLLSVITQHVELKKTLTLLKKIQLQDLFNTNKGKWIEIKVCEFGKIITGNTPSKADDKNYGAHINWCTAEDLSGKYVYDSKLKLSEAGSKRARIIGPNNVLITCIASIGKNSITKVETAFNQQINGIELNENYDPEFVYYLFEANLDKMLAIAGFTAVSIINKSNFENLKLKIPEDQATRYLIGNRLKKIDYLLESLDFKTNSLINIYKSLV